VSKASREKGGYRKGPSPPAEQSLIIGETEKEKRGRGSRVSMSTLVSCTTRKHLKGKKKKTSCFYLRKTKKNASRKIAIAIKERTGKGKAGRTSNGQSQCEEKGNKGTASTQALHIEAHCRGRPVPRCSVKNDTTNPKKPATKRVRTGGRETKKVEHPASETTRGKRGGGGKRGRGLPSTHTIGEYQAAENVIP